MNKQLLLIVAGALTIASTGYVYAAQLYTTDNVIAREAAEGPRGEGQVRGEGRGHKNSVDVNSMILAREATEAPRGADNNNQRRRGRA